MRHKYQALRLALVLSCTTICSHGTANGAPGNSDNLPDSTKNGPSQSPSRSPFQPPALAPPPTPSPGVLTGKSSTTKLYGQVNTFGIACVSSGITPQSTQLPTFIDKIKPGTPAFSSGLAVGDKIMAASVQNNLLVLRISRKDQMYEVRLRTKIDETRIKTPERIQSQLDVWSKLKSYKVSLLIDRSGSMSKQLNDSDKTVWQWAKQSLGTFCIEAERRAGSNFDLDLFNSTNKLHKDLSATKVEAILADTVTTDDTQLAPALRDVFDYELAHLQKPLLMLIVTDGQSISSDQIDAVLMDNMSKFDHGRKLRIVFIQTGYSTQGARFIAALSDKCKQHGIQGYVYTLPFDHVIKDGLASLLDPFI